MHKGVLEEVESVKAEKSFSDKFGITALNNMFKSWLGIIKNDES